jgi:spore germination cell wall hydrolase CwlJ-like protein
MMEVFMTAYRAKAHTANVRRLAIALTVAMSAFAAAYVPQDPKRQAPVAQAKQGGEAPAPALAPAWLLAQEADWSQFRRKARWTPQTEWDASLAQSTVNRNWSRDAQCLATALYFEARGEPERGQKAVAEVIMTRAESGRYPRSICGVVYQNAHRHLACQFTFTCDGKADRPRDRAAWARARRLAVAALSTARHDRPITRWATHYHANYVNPRWASKLRRTATIGTHIFYREGAMRRS